jgi:hypothetical protein
MLNKEERHDHLNWVTFRGPIWATLERLLFHFAKHLDRAKKNNIG